MNKKGTFKEVVRHVYSNTENFANQEKSIKNALTIDQILDNLTFKDGVKLSDELKSQIKDLKWQDGTSVCNSKDIVYEISNVLIKTNDIEPYRIYFSQRNLDTYNPFELPIFEKERNNYLLDIERLRSEKDNVEGSVECKKCKSTKTKTYRIQMRSSDEPETLKHWCLACGARWVE